MRCSHSSATHGMTEDRHAQRERRSKQANLVSRRLGQIVEAIVGFVEGGIALMDDFRRGGSEGLFGRKAVDPALVGELFVSGEIEADEELSVAGGLGVFGVIFFFGVLGRRFSFD